MQSGERHVLVIGGGITGLAAAYNLQSKSAQAGVPIRYTLLEASDRLGGKIISQSQDDFLIEGGPDCFLTRKTAALDLCRELGLEGELISTNEDRRKVYVLNRGRLYPLPEGVMLIVPTRFLPFALSPLISIPGKLRMGMDLFVPRRAVAGDETLGDFVRRRLGTEALDKIAEPLLSGIHVSDPERLSLRSSFPMLLETERKYGSLIKGMLAAKRHAAQHKNGSKESLPMFMALRGGMQQLVDSLGQQLDSRSVRTGQPAVTMRSLNAGGPPYEVRTADGGQYQASAVVLATPSDVSARLLADLDAGLAADLGTIRYVSTAVVSLGYHAEGNTRPLNGFGFIIPKSEGRRITACTWTSTKFDHRAPAGRQLVRCFVGGPGRESLAEQDDASMVAMVREELRQIMGMDAEPDLISVDRWYKANPQYDLDHLDRVAAMKKRAEARGGLYLAGSSYDGVGVPDCIRQGREAACKALARLSN